MTTEPGFKPVFGPNGAVLNAPTMTPEMRAKFEEAGKIPPRSVLLQYTGVILLIGLVGALAMLFVNRPVIEFVQASAWRSGFVVGAVAALLAIALVVQSYRSLVRSELVGRGSRKLELPAWARWLLALTGVLPVIAIACLLFSLVADTAERQLWSAAVGITVANGIMVLALQFAAGKLGWTIDRAR